MSGIKILLELRVSASKKKTLSGVALDMDLELKDKVVLVSCGSQGIGEAIVRSFVAEGARVANVNLAGSEGEILQAELGENCLFIPVNLCKVESCREAVEKTVEHFGRINVVVNNSGINDEVGEDTEPELFVESLQRNLVHYYAIVHYALDELKRSHGSIINMGSEVSLTGQGNTSGCAATNGAISSLTRKWAIDLAKNGIRVNAVISAGFSEIGLKTMPSAVINEEQIEQSIPLKARLATAREIANTVLFLASPRSGYITGLFDHSGSTQFAH